MTYKEQRWGRLIAHYETCRKCTLGRPCPEAQAIVSVQPVTRYLKGHTRANVESEPRRKPRWRVVKGRVTHWFRTKWFNTFGDKWPNE